MIHPSSLFPMIRLLCSNTELPLLVHWICPFTGWHLNYCYNYWHFHHWWCTGYNLLFHLVSTEAIKCLTLSTPLTYSELSNITFVRPAALWDLPGLVGKWHWNKFNEGWKKSYVFLSTWEDKVPHLSTTRKKNQIVNKVENKEQEKMMWTWLNYIQYVSPRERNRLQEVEGQCQRGKRPVVWIINIILRRSAQILWASDPFRWHKWWEFIRGTLDLLLTFQPLKLALSSSKLTSILTPP